MSFNGKMRKDCPCTRVCSERTDTCHSTCLRYAKWRKKLDQENQAVRDKTVTTISEDHKRKQWRDKRYCRNQVRNRIGPDAK